MKSFSREVMLVMSSVKNEVDCWKICLNFRSLCSVTGIKYAISITCVSLTILWWSL